MKWKVSEEQKCYIAGKISGLPLPEYKANFERAKKEVVSMGFKPVCPIDLPHMHGESWQEYMRECLTEMLKCDIVYALTNWNSSKGDAIDRRLEALNYDLKKELRLSRNGR